MGTTGREGIGYLKSWEICGSPDQGQQGERGGKKTKTTAQGNQRKGRGVTSVRAQSKKNVLGREKKGNWKWRRRWKKTLSIEEKIKGTKGKITNYPQAPLEKWVSKGGWG